MDGPQTTSKSISKVHIFHLTHFDGRTLSIDLTILDDVPSNTYDNVHFRPMQVLRP